MRTIPIGSRMKTFLAVIFSVMLTFTMMPVMPFMTGDVHAATNYNLWIGTTQVTSDNASNVLAGTSNDGKVSYDAAKQTLYLNSVDLTANNKNQLHEYLDDCYSFIFCSQMQLTIILSGDNIVNTASVSDNVIERNEAILSNGYNTGEGYSLIIKGDGKNAADTLTATSGPATGLSSAIGFYGPLTIDDCTISATGGSSSRASGGLYAWENSVITLKNGAKLTAVASTAEKMSKGLFGNVLDFPLSSLAYDTDCTIESSGMTYVGPYKITPDYAKSKVTVSHNYDGSSSQEITSGSVDLSSYKYIKISPKSVTPPAPNIYSVTLNGNGGTGTDLTSYTEGTGAALPTDWTREGYSFAGWYDNEGLTGNAVTAITGSDSGAKTFYAKWTLDKPAAPKSVKAKSAGKHSVKLTWSKADGADRYKVYMAKSKAKSAKSAAAAGKYKYIGKTTGTSFAAKGLKAGTKYYFIVKAVNDAGAAKSAAVSARTAKEPVSFTLTNVKGNNVKVHWSKVSGAKGYQVANNHTSSKKIKIKWTGNNSQNTYWSLRKVPGKTYKYKMRYYKIKDGKKVYSSWSSVKSIKVK